MRKTITKVFKEFNLKITISANMKKIDFLDVSFNLHNGKHEPYRKPGDSPLYINTSSNHPPAIIKNIPSAVAKRLSELSSSKEVFDEACPLYKRALKESGYQEDIKYLDAPSEENGAGKRKRRRKIIWFNPPYSKSVKTNVAARFISLIGKHFPRNHKLHKIFNKNTLKPSYSCMPNMASIINGHNKQIISPPDADKHCNCRKKNECPLEGKCQAASVVYEAAVSGPGEDAGRIYIGASEPPFKLRYANHLSSFRNRKYSNSTELSKHAWKLKDRGDNPMIKWRILERAQGYNNITKFCRLCISEKYHIITADKEKVLNSRSELVSKCRHANKFLLSNFTPIT